MAIGFWKFILVTSFLIAMFRGKANLIPHTFSAIPFSVLIWIAYRVARLKPWWPFGAPNESSLLSLASRMNALTERLERSRGNATPAKVSRTLPIQKAAQIEPNFAKAAKLSSDIVMSVRVRSKAVRSKCVRKKVERSKRRPSST